MKYIKYFEAVKFCFCHADSQSLQAKGVSHDWRVNEERVAQRRADFQKTVTRLEEACTQPESSFLLDSVIQRFQP